MIDRTLLKEIPEYIKSEFTGPYPLPSNIQAEADYEGAIVPSNDWALAEALIYVIGQAARMIVCAFIGHDLEDATSERQQESGGFVMYCTRCPWSAKGHF